MKDLLKLIIRNVILLLFIIWASAFIGNLIGGMLNAFFDKGGCNKPISRIGYIVPGFQIGCWLGSPPEEK